MFFNDTTRQQQQLRTATRWSTYALRLCCSCCCWAVFYFGYEIWVKFSMHAGCIHYRWRPSAVRLRERKREHHKETVTAHLSGIAGGSDELHAPYSCLPLSVCETVSLRLSFGYFSVFFTIVTNALDTHSWAHIRTDEIMMDVIIKVFRTLRHCYVLRTELKRTWTMKKIKINPDINDTLWMRKVLQYCINTSVNLFRLFLN